MSSASIPPRMKNTKVVTRYMIPIFLWSVVVTQSIQRLLVRGLVTSWASTCGTARRLAVADPVGVVAGWLVTDMLAPGLEVSALGQDLPQLGDLGVGGLDLLGLLRQPLRVLGRREHLDQRGHEGVLP